MGIFSLFGKKDRPPVDPASPRKKRETDIDDAERLHNAQAQRQVAQATAKKIDAIESAMSSEFIKPASPRKSETTRPQAPQIVTPVVASNTQEIPQHTRPSVGVNTQFLLDSDNEHHAHDVPGLPESEAAPVIEEAAILFANNQPDMVEQVLRSAIQDDQLGSATHTVWSMLFDLYQATAQSIQFENLSIEFANKFETSPPAWLGAVASKAPAGAPHANATPAIPFSGKLDAHIGKLLDRIQALAEKNPTLRLEFVRVTEVDPIGCSLLLSQLQRLQKSGHDLILVGAPELAAKIRATVEVGRRDETEAPWLLLLEILRLLNLEAEFEERSIDYCVTFEVSPPAFIAPKNKVTTALEEPSADNADTDRFMMPTIIEGRIDQLITSMASHAAKHNPAIIDCVRLMRIDFSSAGQLMSHLAPLTQDGNTIEMHNVNYLIAALFNVMGMTDIVRILPRKN